jgi:poly(3-hydroxybutyrate) depolymerase
MGHAWSGGDQRGTHTFPSGPNATERMLDFLLRAE